MSDPQIKLVLRADERPLVAGLTRAATAVTKFSGIAAGSIPLVAETFEGLSASAATMAAGMAPANRSLTLLARSIAKVEPAVAMASASFEAGLVPLQAYTREMQALAAAATAAATAMGGPLRTARSAIRSGNASLPTAASEAAAAGDALSRRAFHQMTANAAFSASPMMALTMGAVQIGMVAAPLAAATAAAAQFEEKMRNVDTMLHLSDASFAEFSETVRTMGANLGATSGPAESAAAMYHIVSAGFSDAAQASDVLKASLIASTAGWSDLTTTTNAIIGIMNAYGSKVGTATDVSDKLFQAVKLGNTTFQALAQGIGPVAAIAADAGISLDELGAAMATLTSRNIRAPIALTAIKSAISGLMAPTASAQKAMAEYGLTINETTLRHDGLIGTLKMINDATGGSAEAWHKILPNIRATTAAMSLMGDQGVDVTNRLHHMAESHDASMEAMEIRQKAVGVQWAAFKANAEAAAVAIGQTLLPAANSLIHGLTGLLNAFNNTSAGTRAFAGAMIGLGTTFTTVAATAKIVSGALGMVGVAAEGAGTAAGAAQVGFISWGVSMSRLVGPAGLVTLLAAGLVAATEAEEEFTRKIQQGVDDGEKMNKVMREHRDLIRDIVENQGHYKPGMSLPGINDTLAGWELGRGALRAANADLKEQLDALPAPHTVGGSGGAYTRDLQEATAAKVAAQAAERSRLQAQIEANDVQIKQLNEKITLARQAHQEGTQIAARHDEHAKTLGQLHALAARDAGAAWKKFEQARKDGALTDAQAVWAAYQTVFNRLEKREHEMKAAYNARGYTTSDGRPAPYQESADYTKAKAERAKLERAAREERHGSISVEKEVLNFFRRYYPGTEITSKFDDPRGVSRYRSRPGTHHADDFSMPAGFPARSPWSGRVTSEAPLTDGRNPEMGIRIEIAPGLYAEILHLRNVRAAVKRGAPVRQGDELGDVARDHAHVSLWRGGSDAWNSGVPLNMAKVGVLDAPDQAGQALADGLKNRKKRQQDIEDTILSASGNVFAKQKFDIRKRYEEQLLTATAEETERLKAAERQELAHVDEARARALTDGEDMIRKVFLKGSGDTLAIKLDEIRRAAIVERRTIADAQREGKITPQQATAASMHSMTSESMASSIAIGVFSNQQAQAGAKAAMENEKHLDQELAQQMAYHASLRAMGRETTQQELANDASLIDAFQGSEDAKLRASKQFSELYQASVKQDTQKEGEVGTEQLQRLAQNLQQKTTMTASAELKLEALRMMLHDRERQRLLQQRQDVTQFVGQVSGKFFGFLNDMLLQHQKFAEAFKSMWQGVEGVVVQALEHIAQKMIEDWVLEQVLGFFTGGISDAAKGALSALGGAGGIGGGAGGILESAGGGFLGGKIPGLHTGGVVVPGGVRSFHAGGLVTLKSNEVFAKLQVGETVRTESQETSLQRRLLGGRGEQPIATPQVTVIIERAEIHHTDDVRGLAEQVGQIVVNRVMAATR